MVFSTGAFLVSWKVIKGAHWALMHQVPRGRDQGGRERV